MNLKQWSQNDAAKTRLHELLGDPVMVAALDLLRDLNLPDREITVPKGANAEQALFYQSGQLSGVHRSIKFLKGLPHLTTEAPSEDKKSNNKEESYFWGEETI